jgi:hypothetical protein
MTRRYLSSGAAVAALLAAAWIATAAVEGQAPDKQPVAAAPAAPWTVRHTAWGDPDLQGMWSHFDPTPLEGPNPDKVAAAAIAAARAKRYGAEGKGDGPGGGMAHEQGRPVSPKRAALVVDPPNGRIPVKPEAAEVPDLDLHGDSWVYHEQGERCITRGMPQGLFTGLSYGRAFQILQTPGYVVIYPEMIHDARIIPVDGRAHVDSRIHLWDGDPVGHWEGDTLVVDTTNYNDKGTVIGDIHQTPTLHVVERFTRVDAKTINYTARFEDPAVFTRPWTIALPHNLDPTYVIYEYACHEGNKEYMEGSLKQGRFRDAEAAKKKTKG